MARRRPGSLVVLLCVAAILAITAYIYRPVLHAQFINWDDDLHLTDNPDFDPPALWRIGQFWDTGISGLYIPVAYSAWMLIGTATMRASPAGPGKYLRPRPFHEANLTAHLLTVAVVWLVLRRLLSRRDARETSAPRTPAN